MKKKIVKIFTGLFIVSLIVGASVPLNVFPFDSAKVEAASTKYNHKHTGYTCYKMNYYVTNKMCKDLKRNYNQLKTPAQIAGYIPIGGLGTAVITNTFSSAVDALNVFVRAANQGKGVQITCNSHFSNTTSYQYSDNFSYKIK
ncbi:bacteriocin 51 precursor BacA [Enterococcus gallinarum]|uniref:bacteriocin 51 precursor BacA n=1 Tax=Enterococcus gallinarum TaxID=1353 RepID=UPI001F5A0640|nr:bacteriocin 51 precursor BacA [Enterococcus gallinarum]